MHLYLHVRSSFSSTADKVSPRGNGWRRSVPATKWQATKRRRRNGGDDTPAKTRRRRKGMYPMHMCMNVEILKQHGQYKIYNI